MFRKRKVLWYIDGTYMCNILIGSILKSIFDLNVMIFNHNYAGDALVLIVKMYLLKQNKRRYVQNQKKNYRNIN